MHAGRIVQRRSRVLGSRAGGDLGDGVTGHRDGERFIGPDALASEIVQPHRERDEYYDRQAQALNVSGHNHSWQCRTREQAAIDVPTPQRQARVLHDCAWDTRHRRRLVF